MLASVLAQLCLDLLVRGVVESGFAVLKRAGVSVGAWRGRACMCGPSLSLALWSYGYGHGALPAVIPARRGLPHRTLLPRQIHTHAHDFVHTSPCTLWRAQTWHTSVPARPLHLHCPSPRRRRRGPAASAPPQGACARRLCASWCPRTGEQACGQRRGHSDQSCLGRPRSPYSRGTLHSGHAPAQA
jgi:hypothetical protein